MKTLRKTNSIWLAILLFAGMFTAQAQDRVEADLTLDLVSSSVWRGVYQGRTALQPEVSLGWKGLALSAWGTAGIADDVREIDLTLSYTIGGLTVSVVDYWCNSDTQRYFDYRPNSTGHCFEGAVAYDFGPVKASWQTFFAGNDLQEADGRRAFSSYLEIAAPFRLAGLDWEATAGVVPWASDYYETKSFNVINLSLQVAKDIPITDRFSLPLFGRLIANPTVGKLFFVAGLTIKIL